MRILVFSATPWNGENSFGVSYSNIFDGIPDLQFASVYCSPGAMDNPFQMKGFQITFSSLIKNLKDPSYPTGRIVENTPDGGERRTTAEQHRFDVARKLRWQILFWGRDFVWKVGRWKSPELCAFLDGFKPDLIFQPIYFSSYLNDIAQFIREYTGAPMIGYISDDNYTLRKFRLSPLYWIDRLWKRQKVKKTINMCELLYVISDIQKREYAEIFKPCCKILTKCADFPPRTFQPETGPHETRLIYAGNIGTGRWKSLALIAEAVEKLKQEGYDVRLDVYSGTPQSANMQKALNRGGCCALHQAVPYRTILKLQQEADILIHVEGLSLTSRLAVHQSFSTKLVDFFEMGKCIFAVGTADEASIDHLLRFDAAVVAQNREEAYQKLKYLLEHPESISAYGQKAYICGRENHSREKMQGMLKADLDHVLAESRSGRSGA